MSNVPVSKSDFYRTLSVVKELFEGKILNLPNGYKIAMAEDLAIGIVMLDSKGNYHIGGLSVMSLSDLNQLLTKYQIGTVIPDGRLN